jgi:branched-chain amino acid transport system permease protein
MTALAQTRARLRPSFLDDPRNRRIASRVAAVALLAFVAILPLFFPLTASFVNTSTLALAYIVMALGLNIVVGFAGLLDLGYVAFYAFGAYAMGWFGSAYLVKEGSTSSVTIFAGPEAETQLGVHLNFLLIVLAAVVICAIAGILIGLPTLRLRGDYIAIVTLAFGEIIRVVAINGEQIKIFGYELTNGRKGITPIDLPALPGYGSLPTTDLNLRPWYWLALVMVLITLFANFRLRDSRLGRAWVAIREDEVAAISMGIPAVKTKLLAYAAGAGFGGMAGAFLGAYLTTVNADQFEFSFSILILAMVILGGLGSVWGVVLGAAVLAFINFEIIQETGPRLLREAGIGVDASQLGFGVFGFLLVVMMVLRPEGLLPERRRKLEMSEGVGTGGESVYEARAS